MMSRTKRRLLWLALLLLLATGLIWLTVPRFVPRRYQVSETLFSHSLSPDGRYLAYIKTYGSTVFVQDLATGATTEAPHVSYERFDLYWTGGSGYLALRGPEGVTLFAPATGESRLIAGVSHIYPVNAGPWVGVKANDTSVQLQHIDRPEQRVSLFSAGTTPLVITGDGPSLGVSRTGETLSLVFSVRPGSAERVVASGFRDVYAAPNASAWLTVNQDRTIYIGSPDVAPKRVAIRAGWHVSSDGFWSPDGRRVAVVVTNGNAEELLVLSTDGQIAFRTAAPFRGDWGTFDELIWWSPDSRYLAFPTFVNPGPWYKKARVHVLDTSTWKERRWKIHGDWSHQLKEFAWVNERVVLARWMDNLFRYELH